MHQKIYIYNFIIFLNNSNLKIIMLSIIFLLVKNFTIPNYPKPQPKSKITLESNFFGKHITNNIKNIELDHTYKISYFEYNSYMFIYKFYSKI